MTPYETASLAVADGNMLAAIIAAAGIWVFGVGMLVQNWLRAKADQRRAAQADTAQQAMEGTLKAMEGMLTALERQGKALEEIIRRTAPPSSQAGPPARPRRIAPGPLAMRQGAFVAMPAAGAGAG